jgi:cyclic dehypoxanthinyl futalosine synthase
LSSPAEGGRGHFGPGRISPEEALALYDTDLLALGEWASEVRRTLHPEPVVTFIIDRNINYTNVCTTKCSFCAFYREAGAPGAYVLTDDELLVKVRETVDLDGTAVMLQGGINPDLGIEYYEHMLSLIKRHYPQVHIHSLSPPEVVHVSRTSGLQVDETLVRLRAAGLDSLPGGGAEILVDSVRKSVSPRKISSDEWLAVMRAAQSIGMWTTATMMFGSVESLADRIEHLHRIRDLQDEHGKFRAFIPWSYSPGHTRLGGDASSGLDYLKTLAISRIFLDNVPNVQASWVTQGPKIGQIALAFGANDLGSTMIEENVVAATGVTNKMMTRDMVTAIADAGFTPVQRDTRYGEVRRFDPVSDPAPEGGDA